MSYPTMTVASIAAPQLLLSNTPPATSSSCSSLIDSGLLVSWLILIWFGWVVGFVWFDSRKPFRRPDIHLHVCTSIKQRACQACPI
jgi:hypothetical protein